jgi:hypothetical protein
MTEKKISRRDAMKILGAAIGGAALSTLPPQWSKPALAASQLPAHARQSAVAGYQIDSVLISADPNNPTNYCFGSFIARATITPPVRDIVLSYAITLDGGVANITDPVPPNGQVATDNNGQASVNITLAVGGGMLAVVWNFVNPGNGTVPSTQSIDFGC